MEEVTLLLGPIQLLLALLQVQGLSHAVAQGLHRGLPSPGLVGGGVHRHLLEQVFVGQTRPVVVDHVHDPHVVTGLVGKLPNAAHHLAVVFLQGLATLVEGGGELVPLLEGHVRAVRKQLLELQQQVLPSGGLHEGLHSTAVLHLLGNPTPQVGDRLGHCQGLRGPPR